MQDKINHEFTNRLKTAIQEAGITKKDLANAAGIKAQSLSRYLGGRIPTTEILNKISDRLNVFPRWLLSGEGPKLIPAMQRMINEPEKKIRDSKDDFENDTIEFGDSILPILGSVSAGKPGFFGEFPEAYQQVKGRFDEKSHYLLKVSGDSMEPNYLDGDTVIIKKLRIGDFPSKNDDVIAIDVDGAVLKRLVYEKVEDPNSSLRRAKPRLSSLNPDYDDHLPLGPDTPIRGIVVGKVERDSDE